MSANNYISIRQLDNGQFKVSERDADTRREMLNIGEATSSLEALEMAQDYINDPENEVEYGISYEHRNTS